MEKSKSKKSQEKPECTKKKAGKVVAEENAINPIENENVADEIPAKKDPSEVEVIEPNDLPEYYDFVDFNIDGHLYRTTLSNKYAGKPKYTVLNPKHIKAFIPGTIHKVYVKEKAKVKANEKLLMLEAMKMKNILFSPMAGVIKKVYVKQGDRVTNNELLIEIA